MATEREHALALLSAIRVALEHDGPVRLNDVERNYLRDACDRALADHPDPLRVGHTSGGQHDGGRLLGEAKMVHKLMSAGSTLRHACEAVGSKLHRDGSKSGAVEKNYRRHRPALLAADRFYGALNAGQPPDAADIKAILGGLS